MRALRVFFRDDAGAAMVEFAVVFVFLFLPVLFGMIEFGRATWVKQTLTAGAREGVRCAIVHGSASGADSVATNAAVTACIAARVPLTPVGITTTYTTTEDPPAPANNTPGSAVKVQVSYLYTPIVGNFSGTIGGKTVQIPLLSARTITSASKQVIAY